MTTKEKILAASLKLFNKNGVERVTTRDVAGHLGISQGNLHYHYSNKESLIKALFQQFVDKTHELSLFKPNWKFSKEDVFKSMLSNYKLMYRFRFLFNENKAVWIRVPELKQKTRQLLIDKKDDLLLLMDYYRKSHVLRADISAAQIEFLSDQFIFTICSWLSSKDYLEKSVDYFVAYTFRLWIPYLQQDEMRGWELLLESKLTA